MYKIVALALIGTIAVSAIQIQSKSRGATSTVEHNLAESSSRAAFVNKAQQELLRKAIAK